MMIYVNDSSNKFIGHMLVYNIALGLNENK